jgi:hypothetical protein
VRVRRALHYIVFAFALRSFFSFLSASPPTILSKECHICGQHAATQQHERQTSVSRDMYPPSGKLIRRPSTSPIQYHESPRKVSKSLSDSLHSVLSIAGGTSREDLSSAIGPMPQETEHGHPHEASSSVATLTSVEGTQCDQRALHL